MTVYNGYTAAGSFLIGTSDIEEEVTMFEPLEIIHNPSQGNLVLLAQIGATGNRAKLAAFMIDHKSYESVFLGTMTVDKFESTMRTKTNIVLVRESGSEAINLFKLELMQVLEGRVLQTSINNDFVFTQVGHRIVAHEVSSIAAQVASFPIGASCIAEKARENEAVNINKPTDAFLSLQCPTYSQIVNGAGEQLFRSELGEQARVAKLFAKTGSKQFIRMLQDLQLQYVSDGAIIWKREEALTQIRQVEVFD